MTCACGCADFELIDGCYVICASCGEQRCEIATDAQQEVEVDKDGKNRFGFLSDAEVPMVDLQGNLMLDAALPFEPPSKTSMGSAHMDKHMRQRYSRIRLERRVQDILKKLIDPLDHAPDVVCRVRRSCEKMLLQLFQKPVVLVATDASTGKEESIDLVAEDEDETEPTTGDSASEKNGYAREKRKRAPTRDIKNRGFRKNAIFAHIVKRMILHFIPEYDERKYNEQVLVPFFRNTPMKRIGKYIQNYGVPVLREAFPEFDEKYERDYLFHLRCKVRRLFSKLNDEGQFRIIFRQKENQYLFDGAGMIIFHPTVVAHLQSWDFATRIGVITCYLGLSTPEEIVCIMQSLEEDCVKPATIHSKLRLDIVNDLMQNIWANSSEWKKLFDEFKHDKKRVYQI